MRTQGFDADALEDLLERRSGLAGISGIGGDMRALRGAAAANADAALAVAMFCYAVRKQVAAMAAALAGIDALVFSGGIGENDRHTRSDVCTGLAWMGVIVDSARNARVPGVVSSDESRVVVRVVQSAEDEQIATEAAKLLSTA